MSPDTLTEHALLATGLAALAVFALRRRPAFAFFAAGFLYLSADEASDIHERIGRHLDQLAGDLPVLQDLDALVVALYGLVFLTVSWQSRAVLLAPPGSRWALGGAAVAAILSVLMDAFVPNRTPGQHTEEYLEAIAATLLAGSFGLHALRALPRPRLPRGFGSARADDVPAVTLDVQHGNLLDDAP